VEAKVAMSEVIALGMGTEAQMVGLDLDTNLDMVLLPPPILVGIPSMQDQSRNSAQTVDPRTELVNMD